MILSSFNIDEQALPLHSDATNTKVVSYIYYRPYKTQTARESPPSGLEHKFKAIKAKSDHAVLDDNSQLNIESSNIESEPVAAAPKTPETNKVDHKTSIQPAFNIPSKKVLTTENQTQSLTINPRAQSLPGDSNDIVDTGVRALVAKGLHQSNNEKLMDLAKTASDEFNTNLLSPKIEAPQFSKEYLVLKESNVT